MPFLRSKQTFQTRMTWTCINLPSLRSNKFKVGQKCGCRQWCEPKRAFHGRLLVQKVAFVWKTARSFISEVSGMRVNDEEDVKIWLKLPLGLRWWEICWKYSPKEQKNITILWTFIWKVFRQVSQSFHNNELFSFATTFYWKQTSIHSRRHRCSICWGLFPLYKTIVYFVASIFSIHSLSSLSSRRICYKFP